MVRNYALASLGFLSLNGFHALPAQAFCDQYARGAEVEVIYQTAETLFQNGADGYQVLEALAPMAQMELNCFERGTMMSLMANAYLLDGLKQAAAEAYYAALSENYLMGLERRKTLYEMAGLYRELDDPRALKAYEDWIHSGGVPNAADDMMIAGLYREAGDYSRALEHAEMAYREATSPKEKTDAEKLMRTLEKRVHGY